MFQLSVKWCLGILVIAAVGLSASRYAGIAIGDSEVKVAIAGDPNAFVQVPASSRADPAIPADILTQEAAPAATCDDIPCTASCRSKGFCEGECVSTTKCLCMFPRKDFALCP